MPRESLSSGKRPLKPAMNPMTSTSASSAVTDKGDLAFTLENRNSKVTTFNPLLTPSPLLEPKVLERKTKMLAHR
ncbi:hypothetical protein CUC08_Gglean001172 [Alternaria sp. MG1]|nr:hypothetical protein CUC08_Gglean001172 [Alternaria sp. MG1]